MSLAQEVALALGSVRESRDEKIARMRAKESDLHAQELALERQEGVISGGL